MSPHRRTKLSAASSRRKLRVATGATSETLGHRMRRWWYRGVRISSLVNCLSYLLLPLAWVLSVTFFTAFRQTTLEHELWLEQEFWFFALGALVWVGAFFGGIRVTGRPWPLHLYVYGHELTHAVWVWFMLGSVLEKKMWSADGGYIVTNRSNFWIALTPYFYPLYSLIVIVVFGVASVFYNVVGSTATFMLMTPLQWLFFLLGITWAFHLSFTIWMIPKGQTDLSAHGTWFSLVVIYLVNLALLSVALIVVATEISFRSFGHELFLNAQDFSAGAWRVLRALWWKAFG